MQHAESSATLLLKYLLLSIFMIKTFVAQISEVGELDDDLGVLRVRKQNNSKWRGTTLTANIYMSGRLQTKHALRYVVALEKRGVG